jgi:hypothetical protein
MLAMHNVKEYAEYAKRFTYSSQYIINIFCILYRFCIFNLFIHLMWFEDDMHEL